MCGFNLEGFLISCVYLAVFIAVLRLLVPWVFSMIGFNFGPLLQIINWIIIAIIVIFVIRVVFSLLSCAGGFHNFLF